MIGPKIAFRSRKYNTDQRSIPVSISDLNISSMSNMAALLATSSGTDRDSDVQYSALSITPVVVSAVRVRPKPGLLPPPAPLA